MIPFVQGMAIVGEVSAEDRMLPMICSAAPAKVDSCCSAFTRVSLWTMASDCCTFNVTQEEAMCAAFVVFLMVFVEDEIPHWSWIMERSLLSSVPFRL